MNCTGKRCIMQFDKVDPATCPCVSYCPQATPPRTKADKIRSMTDEELEKWLIKFICSSAKKYADARASMYKGQLLDWLKQEVEEDR